MMRKFLNIVIVALILTTPLFSQGVRSAGEDSLKSQAKVKSTRGTTKKSSGVFRAIIKEIISSPESKAELEEEIKGIFDYFIDNDSNGIDDRFQSKKLIKSGEGERKKSTKKAKTYPTSKSKKSGKTSKKRLKKRGL